MKNGMHAGTIDTVAIKITWKYSSLTKPVDGSLLPGSHVSDTLYPTIRSSEMGGSCKGSLHCFVVSSKIDCTFSISLTNVISCSTQGL